MGLLIIQSRIISCVHRRGRKASGLRQSTPNQCCSCTSDQRFPPIATGESEGFNCAKDEPEEFLRRLYEFFHPLIDDFSVAAIPLLKREDNGEVF
jgi:hypothetical protein